MAAIRLMLKRLAPRENFSNTLLWTPTPLLGNLAIFFLQIHPEAERTVADGQLGCGGKPQALELLKQFTPGLDAFAVTINDS